MKGIGVFVIILEKKYKTNGVVLELHIFVTNLLMICMLKSVAVLNVG